MSREISACFRGRPRLSSERGFGRGPCLLASGELDEEAAIQHYKLDAIISVGYGVNSVRATQLRQWATSVQRTDTGQPNMGLTHWEKAPDGKVLRTDVTVAKNDLSREELESLGRIVSAYLDLAEERARRKIPMTIEDWAKRLDAFLAFSDYDILQDAVKVSAEVAKAHAESEFEKYRVVQDRLFESDFDRVIKQLKAGGKQDGGGG